MTGVLVAGVLTPVPSYADDGATQLQCDSASTDQPCTQQPGPVSTFGDPSHPCDPTDAQASDCGPDYGVRGLDGCSYKLTQPSSAAATAMADGRVDPDGVWYVRTCGHGRARHSTLVQLAAPPGDDPGTLAPYARMTLQLPAPAAMVHSGPELVGWPAWLWLPDESWQSVTATATAGGQSMTVTATPTLAVWQTGDGLAELCTGPGTPWPAGTDRAQPSPDCGHVYAETPERADTAITVTVLWTIVASGEETQIHLSPRSTTTTIAAATPDTDPPQPEPTP